MNERLKRLKEETIRLNNGGISCSDSSQERLEDKNSDFNSTNAASRIDTNSRHSMNGHEITDFNRTANSFLNGQSSRQQSLAQSLKQRREFHEVIEQERQTLNATTKPLSSSISISH